MIGQTNTASLSMANGLNAAMSPSVPNISGRLNTILSNVEEAVGLASLVIDRIDGTDSASASVQGIRPAGLSSDIDAINDKVYKLQCMVRDILDRL